jgi:hypothetical protein
MAICLQSAMRQANMCGCATELDIFALFLSGLVRCKELPTG